MNLCCICLSRDLDNDYMFFESEISDMVQKLQKMIPQTKFQLEDRQFLCQTCLTSAMESHNFLSQFFQTNFRICHTPKIGPGLKVDIRMLKPDRNYGKHDFLCRICLSSVETPKVCLYESQRNVLHYEWYNVMLSYCDINTELFDLTADPIMCNSCWQHLMTYYSFKKLYFDFHAEVIQFGQKLKTRNIDPSDKKLLLQKFRQLSKRYQLEQMNQADISNFSKKKILELLFLYVLTTENETNFIPGFWKKTLSVWNELNEDDLISKEELITFITLYVNGSLVSKEEYDLIKSQMIQCHMLSRKGRRRRNDMLQYDNSDLVQQTSNIGLLTNNFPNNSSYDDDDDCDDTCPDITSDMNQSFEIKSEGIRDDEITIDSCPELEDQTTCPDRNSKTFMDMKTFQESIIENDYYFKCQKCFFRTRLKLAAMKHTLLHKQDGIRKSLRLQDKRDSIPLNVITTNRRNVRKRKIYSRRRGNTSRYVCTGIKELEVSLQRINPATFNCRRWSLNNNRKELISKFKSD